MNNMHHVTKTGVPKYLHSCSFSDDALAEIEITVQSDDPSRKIYFIKREAARKMLAENRMLIHLSMETHEEGIFGQLTPSIFQH